MITLGSTQSWSIPLDSTSLSLLFSSCHALPEPIMASAPCTHEPSSLESCGSESLNDDYWPRHISSRRSASLNGDYSRHHLSSTSLLPDCAAPVHPFDGDDYHELTSVPSSSTSSPLLCSPRLSERHVFLCFKEPRFWPSVVEGADSDRLPRFLVAAIKARKDEMMRKTRLIVCEGRDGTESSNGDVMIFPDMVRYRGLTHFDVDAFVDEVLVRNRKWLPGKPERLVGTHVFVCAHGNHEAKFGILGPAIIEKFKDQIAARELGACVFVKPCSYIEGYKYARNLIVYSSNSAGEVYGHCYGSVTPENVSSVLDDLCVKGYLADGYDRCSGKLDCGNNQTMRNSLQGNSTDFLTARNGSEPSHDKSVGHANSQINRRVDGYMRVDGYTKVHGQGARKKDCVNDQQRKKVYSSSTWWQASWWFSFWEREDTLAVLAVVGAAASVSIAYHLYRSQSGH